MKLDYRILVVLFLFLVFLNVNIYSQISGEEYILRFPENTQKQINDRFNLYVKYQSENEWDKLFDLLYEERNRETFVKNQKESPNDGAGFFVKEFSSPIVVFPDESNNDWLIIEGCVKIQENTGNVKSVKAFTNVYRINGKWLFTPVELMRQVGGEAEVCKICKK